MAEINEVDQLTDDIEKKMRDDLVKYESGHGIDVNYRRFSLVLSDCDGDVIGVLNAFTAFAEIYIDDMWVDSRHRGKGFGKELISKLEELYKGKGFNNINLCTSTFNAPEFYKKCGFELEFTRRNTKNPQLTKYFFVKFFGDEVQTQGIASVKK